MNTTMAFSSSSTALLALLNDKITTWNRPFWLIEGILFTGLWWPLPFLGKTQHRIRGGTILAAGGEQNGIPPLCSWTVGEEPCRETSTQWWVVWSIGRQIWLSVELSNMSSHNFALVGCRALPIIGTHSWSPTMFSQFPIFILSYIRN